MKATIYIILIISLFFPLGGSFIFLQIQRQLIKKEIKHRIIEGIDKDELVVLRFTRTESEEKLRWKESREFEYGGEMYDIVDSESGGDTVTYWCWWDRAETKLNKHLNEQASRTSEHNPWNQENLKRITTFLQSLDSPSRFNFNLFADSRYCLVPAPEVIYASNCISPPIPPP